MQGSVQARSASEAQPEDGIAQRKLSGSRPVKPEGETADASRRRSQPGRQGQQPVKAGTAQPAEPKDGIRCESEVGRRPCRRRIIRRKSEGRRRSAGSAEQPVKAGSSQPVEPKIRHRSEPGSWPPVEPECRPSTQVEGFVPAQPEDAIASESWRVGLRGSRRNNTGCTLSYQD